MSFNNIKNRSHQHERLDNLTLKGATLHRILRELAFINRYLGNYRAVQKAILSLVPKQKKADLIIYL